MLSIRVTVIDTETVPVTDFFHQRKAKPQGMSRSVPLVKTLEEFIFRHIKLIAVVTDNEIAFGRYYSKRPLICSVTDGIPKQVVNNDIEKLGIDFQAVFLIKLCFDRHGFQLCQFLYRSHMLLNKRQGPEHLFCCKLTVLYFREKVECPAQ